ncbi:hypothetical protein GCM10010401_19320 [Rarobacter faecitabidus]|uniref:Diguanylate cyclase (GGDEF)-like protein n=1 Tax=Rarobacter faecitabidus TaxID=13243 RepID=A0A542ZV14_RARFA|nr:diguanylate cyclase [Rarobacter faecitabidus]TQL64139.1 diguanylate cyclase (GGDEF)-like protein [Rarobacter faecitabidus]
MIKDLALAADRLAAVETAAKIRALADVARPILTIESTVLVSELEVMFRDESIHAVVVNDSAEGRIGLITRAMYGAALTGRLGYGRAVHLRRAAGELADYKALVLPPGTSIADAATRAMDRSRKRRYDPILVSDTEWRVAETGDVTKALVSALASRSVKDALTALPTRTALLYGLARRCERAQGGRARIALVLIRVRGIGKINAQYGQNGGDTILQAVGRRLEATRAPGMDCFRVSGRVFAIVTTLPPLEEVTVVASVDAIRETHLRALAPTEPGIPTSIWPGFDSGAGFTDANVRTADDLLRTAELRLRAARKR